MSDVDKEYLRTTVEYNDLPDTIVQASTNDQRDMRRMGKKQEFTRSFRIITSIAFTSCVMGTWELIITTSTPALVAGGTAGLFWSTIWSYVGQAFVVLSLAEMSSMAPTAGGQYHWVSEFAPHKYQKILSYTSGWLSTLAWNSMVSVTCFLCAQIVQAMIILNNPDYVPERWHTTLITIGFAVSFGSYNTFAAPWLATLEGIFAFLHYLVFIPLVVAMWVLAPEKQSARAALLEFQDNGTGWGPAVATLVGQVTAMFTLVGSDGAVHMAEEIQDASKVVPQSMWWSFLANIPPTLIVLATFCFCLGDTASAIDSATGFPVIDMYSRMARTPGGAIGLTFVTLALVMFIGASAQASTSRQTFAFARDHGLPFARFIGAVHPRYKVPANAIGVNVAFATVLSLINIGSTAAFDAILSIGVVALMATYSISIACVLLKRLRGEPLVHARWTFVKDDTGKLGGSFGRYGVVVNGVGLTYSLWSFFWSFWPPVKHVQPVSMNWAIVIFGAIMGLAAVTYVVHAHDVYDGPVAKVVALEQESVDELSQEKGDDS
ncbi:uncharacterized protein PHACADRAFT_90748 [Phanerochaete carnosa HHB-10118-sp]|uniref:Amino acid permease/ SLC12A domain-containing protein n=1 Tax=Phanerochaete carnosa (strain HHB-10118-sp) TaxID=650164 RepID=K5WF36_PHACS|nr:uncharacterized protein PHACADRAFT_90748 [Phanerochaete carnosa HHB-10118-sp]EKM57694.1 hypothetical protein PHACADRAFT_90748 [Phanerochaete carnosa HHB-10118-sp]